MRFWKFGVFLLCCSLFALPGCGKAEEKPAPAQKPESSFVPSRIRKSEISFYYNKCSYELVMNRDGEKIRCTMRTLKRKDYDAPPASGFVGMKPVTDAPKKGERIFPRGCSFTADEGMLAELDDMLQAEGVTAAAATAKAEEVKPLRLLYVEYNNGKHITVNRPSKDGPFRRLETEAKLAAFMEKLAKEKGQKLYDGSVQLGRVMACRYSSGGGMDGGHRHVELKRITDRDALYESSAKQWNNAPEKTEKKTVDARSLDEMEALGRKYAVDTWPLFPETDLIALDAPTVTLTVTYGEPWSWIKWDLSMGSQDELDKKQREYYKEIRKLLLGK